MIAEVELTEQPEVGMRPEGGGIGPVKPVEGGGGTFGVVLKEQQVEHTGEPTLRDLREALVVAYGTDASTHVTTIPTTATSPSAGRTAVAAATTTMRTAYQAT